MKMGVGWAFKTDAPGFVAWDVFDAVLTSGDIILLDSLSAITAPPRPSRPQRNCQ